MERNEKGMIVDYGDVRYCESNINKMKFFEALWFILNKEGFYIKGIGSNISDYSVLALEFIAISALILFQVFAYPVFIIVAVLWKYFKTKKACKEEN